MKILVLDDDDDRHRAFSRKLVKFEVIQARTYQQAIEALKETVFDAAFLDHDLNMYGYESTAKKKGKTVELTGGDVVDYIVKMHPSKRPAAIIVHSWNPAGALYMVETLKDAGVSVMRWVFSPGFEGLKIDGE